MSTVDRLTELLACPRCDKTPLSNRDHEHYCSACKLAFPLVGGIPWLFAEVDASLGEWRNRLHFELQSLAHEGQRLDGELKSDALSALTRKRLQRQKEATDNHRTSLRDMLAPIDIQSMSASYESYLALRTRLPADQGLQTYYANLHRDWCWGDQENRASLAQIQKVASESEGGESLGTTLVLGAGACRLPYDVHMRMKTECTIAVDFNPLLLLIAKRVMQGETPQIYEFPIAPKSIDDFTVLRELSAPEVVSEHFHLVLGDVLRPSFAAGQFDTVITPWLIDIVSEDFAVFSQRINTLLRPGGRWINFGSLAFDSPHRARRYSREEILELVGNSGFAEPYWHEETIPYMCSPASRHGRQETIFTFAAAKTEHIKAPARHKALPDWIVTGKEPVPLLESFRTQTMTTQIYLFMMSMIDGKRTIKDMAKVMQQQELMTQQEAEPAIRNFLTKMYNDAERQSRY
jgi:uncharacterized protein YbaR (Trm112 family)